MELICPSSLRLAHFSTGSQPSEILLKSTAAARAMPPNALRKIIAAAFEHRPDLAFSVEWMLRNSLLGAFAVKLPQGQFKDFKSSNLTP